MKILSVINNYSLHNKEYDETFNKSESPIIFTKPDSALLKGGKPFFIVDSMGQIDYGIELVVRICKLGKSIPERFAHRYYDAVTVGVNFTAVEQLSRSRKAGLPWTLCNGFDGSVMLGSVLSKEKFLNVQTLRFHLDVNGTTMQEGCSTDMRYKIDNQIAYLSRYFTFKTGDLLFTGIPASEQTACIGQHLEGYVENYKLLEFNIR